MISSAAQEGSGPVPTPPTPKAAIIEAARRELAIATSERLTMSAVASAAGISRPTLYRWFPTKKQLLDAVSADSIEQFDVGLQHIIHSHRNPRIRLDASLRFILTYLDESIYPDPAICEPAVVIENLRATIGPYSQILAVGLGDALREVPAVRAGLLTPQQACELLLRLTYSHYLVPHADADVLLSTIRDLAGIPRRNARGLAS